MKLDYSKTLNEQRDTIENILNENKHYSLQLSQLKKEKEPLELWQLETIKKYIDKMFLDKSSAYARNMSMPQSELQQILIGTMMTISEIKRFIEYLEGENK